MGSLLTEQDISIAGARARTEVPSNSPHLSVAFGKPAQLASDWSREEALRNRAAEGQVLTHGAMAGPCLP